MARKLRPHPKPLVFPPALITLENLSGLGKLVRTRGEEVTLPPDSEWASGVIPEGSLVLWDLIQDLYQTLKPMTKGLRKTPVCPHIEGWFTWDERQAPATRQHASYMYMRTYSDYGPVQRLLWAYHPNHELPELQAGRRHSPCSDRIRLYQFLGWSMPRVPRMVMPVPGWGPETGS